MRLLTIAKIEQPDLTSDIAKDRLEKIRGDIDEQIGISNEIKLKELRKQLNEIACYCLNNPTLVTDIKTIFNLSDNRATIRIRYLIKLKIISIKKDKPIIVLKNENDINDIIKKFNPYSK